MVSTDEMFIVMYIIYYLYHSLKNVIKLNLLEKLPYTIYFKPGLFNLLKYKVTIEPTI
jgi:hypothetical protein